jgi:hypothetical protein
LHLRGQGYEPWSGTMSTLSAMSTSARGRTETPTFEASGAVPPRRRCGLSAVSRTRTTSFGGSCHDPRGRREAADQVTQSYTTWPLRQELNLDYEFRRLARGIRHDGEIFLRTLGRSRTCVNALRRRMPGAARTRAWRVRRESDPRSRFCRPAAAPANELVQETERTMGLEPTIFALATRCSTTELHPQSAGTGTAPATG